MAKEVLSDPLEYRLNTAARHATTNVPISPAEARIGDIRAALTAQRFDSVAQVAVCDPDHRLVGVIRIEDLLAAPEWVSAGEVMDGNPPTIGPGVNQELAAWRAVQHGESSIAVVDSSNLFRGFIPPSRLLSILLAEHDEDMARLGGFVSGLSSARTASEEPVMKRYWHRMPWLLVGLAGGLLSAKVVGSFEGELEANILLSFFVPAVVYLADAVGTQTEAVVIRGISVGVPIRRVFRLESITGLLVGLSLSAAFFPIVLLLWDQADVALSVSIAIMSACSIASIVAMLLPWVLQALGRDPAFGSGPLATVIQDVLSIIIFFLTASVLV
jgi:magnesium transporter